MRRLFLARDSDHIRADRPLSSLSLGTRYAWMEPHHYAAMAHDGGSRPATRWTHHVGAMLPDLCQRRHVFIDSMVWEQRGGNSDATNKIKKMNDSQINSGVRQEFVKAKPEVMPEPTYWPFVFAVSLMFLGWGLLTLW